MTAWLIKEPEHDFMFQLYFYVYLNLNMQKDIFLLSGKSQQIVVI